MEKPEWQDQIEETRRRIFEPKESPVKSDETWETQLQKSREQGGHL